MKSYQIKNAGIVLLSNYLPLLFERLGLIENHEFRDDAPKQKAVYALQYCATGLNEFISELNCLNNVLCGLPIDYCTSDEFEKFNPKELELMNGLLKAIINDWSKMSHSSIQNMREAFLKRNALLTVKDDSWEIFVEKATFDMLLDSIPFSFSIIKYPWMLKPLNVKWR